MSEATNYLYRAAIMWGASAFLALETTTNVWPAACILGVTVGLATFCSLRWLRP